MDVLDIKETAQRWGISPRRVQVLCESNRIYGARKIGGSWAIPDDAEKPVDGRYKKVETQFTSIDLFAGPGGICTGFHWAGIKALIAVEWSYWTVQTYAASHDADIFNLAEYLDGTMENPGQYFNRRDDQKTLLIFGDINKVSNELIRKILHERFGVESVDIVTGGAPCESFSMAGDRKEDDDRNELYQNVLRIARAVDSRMFLFENVKGLFSKKLDGKKGGMYKAICNDFQSDAYDGASFRLAETDESKVLLKAIDYGVPQARERLFLVGINKELPESVVYHYPEKTHGPGRKFAYVTVGDAIMDLPEAGNEPDQLVKYDEIYTDIRLWPKRLGIYNEKEQQTLDDKAGADEAFVSAHEEVTIGKEKQIMCYRANADDKGMGTRDNFLDCMRGSRLKPLVKFDEEIVKSHKAPGHTKKMKQRIQSIMPGEGMKAAYERLVQEGKENFANGVFPKKLYAARNRRLLLTEPSFTVTSHCLDEMIHPVYDRGMTPREVARLQSFPDWYRFKGPFVKFHSDPDQDRYEQIGDAIPPLLAYALGREVVKTLKTIHSLDKK